MLIVDKEIRELCRNRWVKNFPGGVIPPMIDPFSEAVSGNGIISYGLTSAGYDIRLAPEVLIFKNTSSECIDPKRFSDDVYKKEMFDELLVYTVGNDQFVTIPPHSYVLGRSYEYLRIPKNLKVRAVGKSTLARSGILINCCPGEPEWEGHLVLEIGNITPCSAILYIMQGISQLEFEVLSDNPETSYKDKKGKYQGQTGVTLAKVL